MKKLITSAAVVLGLAVAGNAMAQETILNTMTKANNALEEAQQKIDAKKAELEAQKAAREVLSKDPSLEWPMPLNCRWTIPMPKSRLNRNVSETTLII